MTGKLGAAAAGDAAQEVTSLFALEQAKELKEANGALKKDGARLAKELKVVEARASKVEEKNKKLLKEKSELENLLASESKDKKEASRKLRLVEDQVRRAAAEPAHDSTWHARAFHRGLAPDTLHRFRARKKRQLRSGAVTSRARLPRWRSRSRQQIWTVLKYDGPNHFALHHRRSRPRSTQSRG